MKKTLALLLVLSVLFSLCGSIALAEDLPVEESLPSSFDLRSVDTDGDGIGDRCYVTPVKLQNPFGTCWGFATIAAAEISILGSVLNYNPDAWKTLNLSERQLAYFSRVPLNDPDNPQSGEGFYVNNIHDATEVYNTGGSVIIATSTFAQGIGPTSEHNETNGTGDLFKYFGAEKNTAQRYIDGRYQNFCYSDEDDWTIPEEFRFEKDYLLVETFTLDSPAQRDDKLHYVYAEENTMEIKKQLMQIRGVTIGFHADTSNPDQDAMEEGDYLNTKTWAHYTWNTNAGSNHAVTIIGWDDNYPKENFISGHQPPENGAWLVKNSWGTGERDFPNMGTKSWGIQVQKTDDDGNLIVDADGNPVMVGSGYFWLSYYDTSLTYPETFVFDIPYEKEYTNQYDYVPAMSMYDQEYDDLTSMANVFTAKQSQYLTGISCQTEDKNTTVEYKIYYLCSDYADPEDGLLAASGTVSYPYPGYHRIALQEALPIQRNQPYSVIITMINTEGKYNILATKATSADGMGSLAKSVSQTAIINPGESYLFTDGTWQDFKDVSAAIIKEDLDAANSQLSASELGAVASITITFDNFPIKAYSTAIYGNMHMELNSDNDTLSIREGENKTTVRLSFKGASQLEMGNPEIVWALLPRSEGSAEIEPAKGGSQVNVTAHKAEPIYLTVSLKDHPELGITVYKLAVSAAAPSIAILNQQQFVYTGDEIKPTVLVIGDSILLKEDEDYILQYADNISCGVAKVDICQLIDGIPVQTPALTKYFTILPQKAEITGSHLNGSTLSLTVFSQWTSGITGYEINYTKTGEDEVHTIQIKDQSAGIDIPDLESGAEYTVTVRAFVDVSAAEKDPTFDNILYGEASDPLTVKVDQ